MLRVATVVLATLVLVLTIAVMADEHKCTRSIQLFNGKNLAGWQAHLVDPDAKMEEVWSVEDGILVCKGEPFGFLYTKKAFTNYKLIVEWRWAPGEEPGNSGVLMRVTGDPPTFLTKCVEAQLKHGDAGDVWAFYGFDVAGDKDRFVDVEHESLGRLKGVRKMKNAEKPAGEWNRYEITLQGDKLILMINGEKINEAKGLTVEAGAIGLQSEGGIIHFRTVELIPVVK